MRLAVGLVLGLSLAACAPKPAEPAVVTLGSLAPIVATSARVDEPPAHRRSPAAPSGYVEVVVHGLEPAMQGGSTLVVGPRDANVVLQILIGGSEAVSIDKRRKGERFERPLTHDLLDAALHELGASVVKVHIDDKRGAAVVATVFIENGDRTIELDARASDAIALALGNRAPIYCAKRLLDAEGIPRAPAPPEPP